MTTTPEGRVLPFAKPRKEIETAGDPDEPGTEIAVPDDDTLTGEIVLDNNGAVPEQRSLPVPVPVNPTGVLSAPWETPGERRQVLPVWLLNREKRRKAAKWAARTTAHQMAFHGWNSPKYLARIMRYVPPGTWALMAATWKWVFDHEAKPLRAAAVASNNFTEYDRLVGRRNQRVKIRSLILAGIVALGVTAVLGVWFFAPWWVSMICAALAVVALAQLGKGADRRLVDQAVVAPRVRRLSADVVIRAFTVAGLCTADSPIAFATPIHLDGNGWRVILDLPFGTTASKAIKKREDIASGLDVDERQVFLDRVRGETGSARRVELWVCEVDPLSVPAGRSPLIKATRVNFWHPWPLGVGPRGEQVMFSLLWASILIGAIPRRGKTFVARLITLAAALDPDVRIYVYDLKGGADWIPFSRLAHRFQLGDRTDPDTGIDPVQALLDDMKELQAEIDERYRALRRLPPEVCPEGKLTEDIGRDPRYKMPQILVAIDEIQRAFEHADLGKDLEDVLTDVVKVGPAVGVMFIDATQKPDKTATPARFRDQHGIRFGLYVPAWQVSEVILGAGAYSEGLDCSKLPPGAKGTGILRGVGDEGSVEGGATVRTYLADSRDAKAICDRGRRLREDKGTLTGAALGEMPTTVQDTYSVAVDVVVVLAHEEKAHSDVLCARLAERWPERYEGWGPRQLGAALKPHKVATRDVWAMGLDGQRTNRNGVVRADVMAVLETPADA